MPFQSTHPARGATFNLGHNFGLLYVISIHAPREGCDPTAGRGRYLRDNFNPRTPRGVRRGWPERRPPPHNNFNPRTPRGVRLDRLRRGVPGRRISIHAPREGCDTPEQRQIARWIEFQSTHPARGATEAECGRLLMSLLISIHAPREGYDGFGTGDVFGWRYFNPRTPRGVRLSMERYTYQDGGFQSTHPARGATPRFA